MLNIRLADSRAESGTVLHEGEELVAIKPVFAYDLHVSDMHSDLGWGFGSSSKRRVGEFARGLLEELRGCEASTEVAVHFGNMQVICKNRLCF